MKRIYSIISILLVLTLLMVGCSTEEREANQPEVQQATQSDIDKVDSENPIEEVDEEQPEEVDEPDEEIYSTRLIEMMQSKHYTMKMNTIVNMEGRQIEVQTTTVVADGQSATTIESDEVSMTTILKDDKAYVIMHDQKMILVAPMSESIEEAESGLDEIDFEKLEYLGKGKAIFLGNERNYEEYKVDVGIVRYYFDGKELDGMEIISDDASTIMDIQFYSNDVDMSVFELPKDYMQIGN